MADTPVQILAQVSLDLRRASRQLKEFAQASSARLDIVNEKQAISKIQRVGNEAKKATSFAEKFGDALALKTEQFAVYTVAAAAIGKVTFELAKAIREAIRFEQEMVRLSQVFDNNVASNDHLRDSIRRLAVEYGQSANQLARTSVILAQTGLTAGETADALDALTKTTLAATFKNIERTTEGAVAIMQQFELEADQLGDVFDKINTVTKQFAVESDDVVEAVKRAGSVFSATGGTFEEFLALFTSIRSTSRETAETISTGLRTIVARVQRPKVIDYFKELGIELETVDGRFIGPLKAIQAISDGLSRLGIVAGQTKFAEVVEQLGGLRQVARVIPALQQTGKQQEALALQQQAAGSVARDAAKAQETLAVQFEQTRQRFEELVSNITQTSSFQALAETFLRVSNSLITLADSLREVLPLLIALQGLRIGSALVSGTRRIFGGDGNSRLSSPPFQIGGVLGFSSGAKVPGAGNRDSVLAALTPGEVVLNRRQQQNLATIYGANSSSIFKAIGVPGYNTGRGGSENFSPATRRLLQSENPVDVFEEGIDLNAEFEKSRQSVESHAKAMEKDEQAMRDRRAVEEREEAKLRKKRQDAAKKGVETKRRNRESLDISEDARFTARQERREKFDQSQAINLQRQKDKTLEAERAGEKRLAADRQRQLKEQRESFFDQGTFEGRSGTYGLQRDRQARDPRGRFLGQGVYGVGVPGVAQPGAAGPGRYSLSGTTYGLRQQQAAEVATYGIGQDVYGLRQPQRQTGPTYALRPDSGTGGLYGPFPAESLADKEGSILEEINARRENKERAGLIKLRRFMQEGGDPEEFGPPLEGGSVPGFNKLNQQVNNFVAGANKAAQSFGKLTAASGAASIGIFALQSIADPASEAGKNIGSLGNIVIQATVAFGILKTVSEALASAKSRELLQSLSVGKIPQLGGGNLGGGLRSAAGSVGGVLKSIGIVPVLATLTVGALAAGEALRRMADDADEAAEYAIERGRSLQAETSARRSATLRSRSPLGFGAAGAAAGAAVGSILPGIGTAIGALVGGIGGILASSLGAFDSLNRSVIDHAGEMAKSRADIVRFNNEIKILTKSTENLKDRFSTVRTRGAKSGVIDQLINQANRTTGGANQVQLGAAIARRKEAQGRVDALEGTPGDALNRAKESLDARKAEEKVIREKVDKELGSIRDALDLAKKNNTLEEAILKLNGDKRILLDSENRIVRESLQAGSALAGVFEELASDMGETDALQKLTSTFLESSDIINHYNRILGKAFSSLNNDLETFRFGSIEEKITRLSQANQARQISAAVAAGDVSGIGVGQKGGLDFLKQFLGTGLKIGGQTAEQTLYGEGGLFAQDLQRIFPEATDDEIKKAVAGMAEAANIDQAILEASKEQVNILEAIRKGLGIETEEETMKREIQEFQARDRAVARQQVARERFAQLPASLQEQLTTQFRSGDIDPEQAIRAAARVDAGTRTIIEGDFGYGATERDVNLPTQEEINTLREAFTEFKEGINKLDLTIKEGAGLIPSEININMQGQPTTNPIRDIQNNAVNPYSSPPVSIAPESQGG